MARWEDKGLRPLSRELVNQYDLNIKKCQYIRSSYFLDTNNGKYMLRKIDIPKEQIFFNYEVDKQIYGGIVDNINHIYPTKKNIPYSQLGDSYYLMQRYIVGEETDFKAYEDLRGIVDAVAKFHKNAVNIDSLTREVSEVRIKNVYDYYNKRKLENIKLKKSIGTLRQKSTFEFMFMDGYDIYNELENMALSSISSELVEEVIKDVRQKRCVAHKDINYHTISRVGCDEYVINNLDKCNYDIQVLDLAQILSKIMQKNEWNSDMLYRLVGEYNKINPLSKSELAILKFSMIYPEKFNSICFKYMSSKRRWNYNMFEKKWESMLDYQTNQIEVAKQIIKW